MNGKPTSHPELNARILSKCINKVLSCSKVAEVPYMVALTQIFPILINHLKSFNQGGVKYCVESAGYLLHQKPVAKFDAKYGGCGCEVADFMVICEDDESQLRNAVLLQAKCSREIDKKSGCHSLPKDRSLNQLQLYTEWPKFNLDGDSRVFDLYPKASMPGAQYLFVRSWRKPNVTIASPARTMAIERPSLPAYLMGMLRFDGRCGKPFGIKSKNDEWTKLIDKLRQIVVSSDGLRCRSIDECNIFSRCSSQNLVDTIIAEAEGGGNHDDIDLIAALRNLREQLPDWSFNNEKVYPEIPLTVTMRAAA